MVKKIKFVLPLLFALVCVCSLSFDSRASDNVFFPPICEPATGENQGYLITQFRNNSSGQDLYIVWFWNLSTYTKTNAISQASSRMHLTIGSNYIDFSASSEAINTYVCGNISSAYYDTCIPEYSSGIDSESFYFSYRPPGYSLVGFSYKGNVGNVNIDNVNINLRPTPVWNDQKTIYDKIVDVYSEIISVNANITTQANRLLNELGYTNDCLERLLEIQENILAEEKKQTTWLEKIFDWLNETKEEERQEVQTQGSSSVSQGSDSIENSGQGFGNSLGGLVSSMSYSGTECSWTFPQVKIPRIEGVMDEVVLIEEHKIDFGMWVDAIPSNIMLLIRSVLTGALIIYCFKELYGTISYVLTLKGSGVNE